MRTDLHNLLFNIPVHRDLRGSLAVVDAWWGDCPFQVERVFWIFGVAPGGERGGHAHLGQHELLVAVSGSVSVEVEWQGCKEVFQLEEPTLGLHIPPGAWCRLFNFSEGAVCVCMASGPYDAAGDVAAPAP